MKRVFAAIAVVVFCTASAALAQTGSGPQIDDTDTGGATPAELVDILLGPNSDAIVSKFVLTGDARCAASTTRARSRR